MKPDSECTQLTTAMSLYKRASEMEAELDAGGGDAESQEEERGRIQKLKARADKLLA